MALHFSKLLRVSHSLKRVTLCESRAIPSTILPCRHKGDSVPYKNAVDEFHASATQADKGKIYDKKPFKITCEAGKSYMWCSCGYSKNQPFCDGTHKSPFLKIKLRPIRFVPTETKEYWLCNCKQTGNRPFCDGTHRKDDVQAA